MGLTRIGQVDLDIRLAEAEFTGVVQAHAHG
jgi:hypothetical protein